MSEAPDDPVSPRAPSTKKDAPPNQDAQNAESDLRKMAERARERDVPMDAETEQALLGAILINNDAFERVSQFLKPEHFSEDVHRRLFEAIESLIRTNKTATVATLRHFFKHDVAMEELGGPNYLARLTSFAPTVSNARDFGRAILEMAQRRELIRVANDIATVAYDPPLDQTPQDLIEAAERDLYQIAERAQFGTGPRRFSLAMAGALKQIEKAFESKSGVSGIPTGFIGIDKKLGGLQPSDLIIIAGRPGMGKTALATNIAYRAAREYYLTKGKSGGRVLFFSLEMSAEQLAARILSECTEIDSINLRRGGIETLQLHRLFDTAQELENLPLLIDDSGGLSIAQIASRARRAKRQGQLDMVFVDYLQLLAGSGSKRSQENRVQEVTEVTKGLKTLAKELNVPVIALAQLSRGVDARDDKRPVLSDLRESGSIEQDADVVMFVYREAYYLLTKEPSDTGSDEWRKWDEKKKRLEDIADVLIEKHRHGDTGKVTLKFERKFARFDNLAEGTQLPEQR